MPNRIIKESIVRSRSIDSLSTFAETVFYRLITIVDDYGRYYADPLLVKAALFPLKEDLRSKTVKDALQELVSNGMIEIYDVENRPYLQMPRWSAHQRIRNKYAKYPNPQGVYESLEHYQTPASDANPPQGAAVCDNKRQQATTSDMSKALDSEPRQNAAERGDTSLQSNPIRKNESNPIQSRERAPARVTLGKHGHVILSEEELESFKRAYPSMWEAAIARMDEYMEQHWDWEPGDHYKKLTAWCRQDMGRMTEPGQKSSRMRRSDATKTVSAQMYEQRSNTENSSDDIPEWIREIQEKTGA